MTGGLGRYCVRVLLWTLACNGGTEDCVRCELTDANTYSYSSELDLPVVTAASKSDVVIEWSGITTDLNGLAADPSDVDEVTLVVFENLEHAELMEGLASDSLAQADASLFAECLPTGTSCALSEFYILDVAVDADEHFVETRGLFMIAIGIDGRPGMMRGLVLEASDDSDVEAVSVDDTMGSLVVDVDLRSLSPVRPGVPDPELDWGDVEHDAHGHALQLQSIDTMIVGRYDAELSELESRLAEIRDLGSDVWEVDVTGRASYDLAEIEGFPGLDTPGTWLVAWMCSTCTDPAPRVLTVLEMP